MPASIASAGGDSLSVRSAHFSAYVAFSPGTVAAAQAHEYLILILGELYGRSVHTFAEALLEVCRSEADASAAFQRTHGSYACVLVDARHSRVALVSDHVNSRKLFWSQREGLCWIANHEGFSSMPDATPTLDPAGLSSTLVNGIPINSRTLHAPIAATRRATIHTLSEAGTSRQYYWNYEFAPQSRPIGSLKQELGDLIIAAIDRRVVPNEAVFVSLSGGYDSTTLVAGLVANGVKNARCLSYTKLMGSEQPDVLVARETARIAGYEHRTIRGFEARLRDVVLDNVRFGHGNARLVVATDAWREIEGVLRAAHPSCLFAGDECFGWDEGEFRSREDVLGALGFRSWAAAGWLRTRLPQGTNRLLDDALHADFEEILAQAPSSQESQDLADWLYLEQRLPRVLAWREAFASRGAPVRQPLLDKDVLAFLQTVPPTLRQNRTLFLNTITERFPAFFGRPRPPGGWEVGAWTRRVVQADRAEIERLIKTGDSPLDDWIPPTILIELLRRQRRFSLQAAARRVFRAGLRVGWSRGARKAYTVQALDRPINEGVLLVRALLLRLVLQPRSMTAALVPGGPA